MTEETRNEIEQTVICLCKYIRNSVNNTTIPDKEMETLPGIVYGLSQLIDSFNQIEFKKRLTSNKRG